MLTGMVSIADRYGDHAILLAMKNNESGTAEAYQDALNHAPEAARQVIARACKDERRHMSWLASILSELNAGGSYRGVGPSIRPDASSPPPGYS